MACPVIISPFKRTTGQSNWGCATGMVYLDCKEALNGQDEEMLIEL